MSDARLDRHVEWLEADGLGGFASGTTTGIATRRYHALLLAAAHPPSDRWVLVNGCVAWLETHQGTLQLTRHHYAPDVTTDAALTITRCELTPWPTLHYEGAGLSLTQEILAEHGSPCVLVRFRLHSAGARVRLQLRPLLSGREFHQLQHENPAFQFEPAIEGALLTWTPYPGVPAVRSWSNGQYRHAPDWFRQFRYTEEQARGLDCDEDLAAPGVLSFDLSEATEALWLLSAATPKAPALTSSNAEAYAHGLLERERARRASFASDLERAADAYIVERGEGLTVIAGYPWFGDWGRDTFIALRGLCLATGRLADARRILVEWSSVVSQGMLPNRFPDRGAAEAEYNSVDAALWYVIVTSELLRHPEAERLLSANDRQALSAAMTQIVSGYAAGTRYGIRRDAHGLLCAGEAGSQLTWMDAKVGDHVVTPRWGKPVEIQALWLNALDALSPWSNQFREWLKQGRQSFEQRFWNSETDCLFDVVDVCGHAGENDPSVRPNQILAAGGLSFIPLSRELARRVVDCVEEELWTPAGLRSLSPRDPNYHAHYTGGVWQRDTAYHQGTVWPWLLGPFVEAWVRSRGATLTAKREARARFIDPLRQHFHTADAGHISEIADGDAPFTARGCPFQAWSVAELLRLELTVLRV